MENRYYVYCYLDPRRPGHYYYDGLDFCFLYEPFYIGRGCGDRYSDHTREVYNRQKPTNRIRYGKISKIIKENLLPIVFLLKENINLEESLLLEINYISNIGRIDLKNGPLSNLTTGGDGGKQVSPLTRKYFSNLFSGMGNPMFGISRYGSDNPFYNKKHTEETKFKISNKNLGKIPWNKGIRHKSISGENNFNVLDYMIISPTGDIYKIKSCHIADFCNEHNLSERNFRRYKNKGKIPPYKQGKNLPSRINSTGWELITC